MTSWQGYEGRLWSRPGASQKLRHRLQVVLVEGYHALGMRILEDEPKAKRGGSDLRDTLSRVSKDIGKHERLLYRAVQFARKCPDLLPAWAPARLFQILTILSRELTTLGGAYY